MLPHLVAVAVGLGREPERAVAALERLLPSVREDVPLQTALPGELASAEWTSDLVRGGGVGGHLLPVLARLLVPLEHGEAHQATTS